MFTRFKNNKKNLLTTFTILTLCTVILLLKPQEVSATLPVIDYAHIAVSEIGNIALADIAVNTFVTAEEEVKNVTVKEYWLDYVGWMAANAAIEIMADSIIDWINSGFNGSPSFITDIGGFLTDVGDQTVGDFIAGSSLAFLCSPFSLDIKIALTLQFGGEREARCTLTDVFENTDNALDDLGNNWSWSKWNNISQTQNNAYGSYMEGYMGLTLKMAEEKDKEIIKSNWGGGFLSFDDCEDDVTKEECRDVAQMTGDITKVCTPVTTPGKCTTKTPGTTISESLNHTLGLGQDKLVVADEIDEIIGALLSQLMKAVFNSAGGLFSANPGGDDDGNFTKMPSAQLKEFIDDAIQIETDYIAWKKKSLAVVKLAESYLLALIACWTDYPGIPPAEPPINKQTEIGAAQNIIDTITTNHKTKLDANIKSVQDNIDLKLNPLLTELAGITDDEGNSDPNALLLIWDKFKALTGLHTDSDVVSAEREFQGPPIENGIESRMKVIINQVVTDSIECKAGGGTFTKP